MGSFSPALDLNARHATRGAGAPTLVGERQRRDLLGQQSVDHGDQLRDKHARHVAIKDESPGGRSRLGAYG